MKYLIDKLSDLDHLIVQELENSINSLESNYFFSITEKYDELDGMKFYKFILDVIDKLFKSIKLIDNDDALKNSEKHNIFLESYRKVYQNLEEEYKAYYPKAFKKTYEFWSLKNYKPYFKNDPEIIEKLFNDIRSNNLINKSSDYTESENDRNAIIKYLINLGSKCKDGENCENKFLSFERDLEKKGFIDATHTVWISNAASLIRFFFFCINKKHRVLRDHHAHEEGQVKAFMKLRELYNFHDSPTVNFIDKMNIAKNSKKYGDQFTFLIKDY